MLLPVINSMLAELAGVGTIGLVLQLTLAFFAHPVEKLSDVCFGEGETLVEAFEFIHLRVFEVAVAFFLANALLLSTFIAGEARLTAAVLAAMQAGVTSATVCLYATFWLAARFAYTLVYAINGPLLSVVRSLIFVIALAVVGKLFALAAEQVSQPQSQQ